MNALAYIRTTYHVPAQKGGRIRFMGHGMATIKGARDARLAVYFDGERRITYLHPTWDVEYLVEQEGGK